MLKPLIYAIQFLTRLPVPGQNQLLSDREQGLSVLFYPAVGLLIGLLLVSIGLIFHSAEPLLQAALVLMAWVVVTGGLHIDGLADLADAWVGGQGDRERTLEIMKDPASGPIAVAAVVLLLMVKLAALVTLLSHGYWSALLLIPMFGRSALVAALLTMPYIRAGGLGATFAANLPSRGARWLLFAQVLFGFALLGWDSIGVLGAILILFYLVRKGLMERLGGVTGDAAGALCELTELTGLVAVALLA